MGIRPGTNPVSKALDALLRGLIPLIARPIVTAVRQAEIALDLPPSGRGLERVVFSPTLIAASGSPLLDYGRTDRPAHLTFVGEISAPPRVSTALPDWWGEIEGRRVVLITQGTLNIDPDDLLRPALRALAERDVLVVATTGVPGDDALPFPVPSNARVAGFIPYAELLPRVDLVVTNGGWGGTLAALGHGIPLVIAGGDLDKPEVAARVAWAGAAVNLRTGRPKADVIGAAVERVLANPSFRHGAEQVGTQLRDLGGAGRVADLLEASVMP